jgi:uncharacterized lipoprotein YmbA
MIVPMIHRLPACALLGLALGGCGSTPVTHYYSLLPAADTAAATAGPPLQFEMLPVNLPAQVDRAEMVVRQGDELTPVDTRQWAAPLGNELQNAFSVALTRRLGAHDVYGLPHDATLPTYRVKIAVQRFDSALGGVARIDASWSVQRDGDKASAICSSSATENLAPGYEALAAGHQKAVDAIATQIAQSLSAAVAAHSGVHCPG